VAVALAQPESNGEVVAELAGAASPKEVASVATQVARVLSLDHDARGLAAIGARDPVVRGLLDATPGFRPVCFPSPYEAAAWGVLAQRIAMPVAAAIKQRLAVATGTIASSWNRELHPSPAPERLLGLQSFGGVSAEKLTRLHAVALAALDGKLDAARLRAMPRTEAIDELRGIRGIGPWTAEHILLRGCGVVDEMPSLEPRALQRHSASPRGGVRTACGSRSWSS
jgi:DNA-3-methyladenine glycosylase II